MEMKTYRDIPQLESNRRINLQPGDLISVQEKIDGANMSLRFDTESGSVVGFSRDNPLSPANTIRGAYEWVQTLDPTKFEEVLGDRYILFGEWLAPHAVIYPDEMYQKMNAYDV